MLCSEKQCIPVLGFFSPGTLRFIYSPEIFYIHKNVRTCIMKALFLSVGIHFLFYEVTIHTSILTVVSQASYWWIFKSNMVLKSLASPHSCPLSSALDVLAASNYSWSHSGWLSPSTFSHKSLFRSAVRGLPLQLQEFSTFYHFSSSWESSVMVAGIWLIRFIFH